MFATASAARTPFLSFEPRRESHVHVCGCRYDLRGRRRVVYFKLRRVLSADYDLLSIYVERPPRHVCVAERRLLLTYRTYVGINNRQPNGSLSIAYMYRMCSGGQQ